MCIFQEVFCNFSSFFFFFLIEKNFSEDRRLLFSLHKTRFTPAFYTVVTHSSIEVAASPEWGGCRVFG